DHDVAVAGILRATDDDDVAVEDAGLDHRVALDAEQEVTAQVLGYRELVLDVLVGEERSARGDLAEERELRQRDDRRLIAAGQLERARLRRIALEEPRTFEVREVRVHGGG